MNQANHSRDAHKAANPMVWLMVKFRGQCVYCDGRAIEAHGKRSREIASRMNCATRDHLIPRSRGGSGGVANTVLACRRCNEAKANMTADEFASFKATGKFPKSYVAFLESLAQDRLNIPRA